METFAFTAGDGLPLKLRRVWSPAGADRAPVLLVHGAGNRGDTFRALTNHLVANGFDVWLLDWRASKEVGFVEWTLRDAATHDHPAAVREVLKHTGAASIKIVAHCVGAASVAMAAADGLLPQVDTIITSGFTLHPVVPKLSRAKLSTLVPLIAPLTRHVSPAWGDRPDGLLARIMRLVVRGLHRECGNNVCRMASFIFGGGRSALWEHGNLDAETHEWLRGEFGAVPVSFFQEIAAAVRAGRLGSGRVESDARFVFLVGERNRTFLPESQRRSHALLERQQPGRHALHAFPRYGHLDLIIGHAAARDVFPAIVEELAS